MADLARMRADMRQCEPLLAWDGWTPTEIDAIGDAIRQALSVGDKGLVDCWDGWLASKAAEAVFWNVGARPNAVALSEMVIEPKGNQQ